VTDADFQRAAKSGARALQNAELQPTALGCDSAPETTQGQENPGLASAAATDRILLQSVGMGAEGFEPPTSRV
jgi:hypothetical protein